MSIEQYFQDSPQQPSQPSYPQTPAPQPPPSQPTQPGQPAQFGQFQVQPGQPTPGSTPVQEPPPQTPPQTPAQPQDPFLPPQQPTQPGQPAPTVPETQQPPVDERLERLAGAFGIETKGRDPKVVNEMLDFVATQYLQAGLAPPQMAAPDPEPSASGVPADTDDLDLSELDEKTAAVVKKMRQDQKALTDQIQRQQQSQQMAQQRQMQAYQHELSRRVQSTVDGMASSRYGTSYSRTPAQQMAFQNLVRTADSLVKGMGGRPPQIETVLELAARYESGQQFGAAPQQPPPHAMEPRSGNMPPVPGGDVPHVPPQHDPFGLMTGPNSDPRYRAAISEILNRR